MEPQRKTGQGCGQRKGKGSEKDRHGLRKEGSRNMKDERREQ